MGASESTAGDAHGGGATLAGEFNKDEFRRGDRVLIVPKLKALDDPNLIAKLQNQNPLGGSQGSKAGNTSSAAPVAAQAEAEPAEAASGTTLVHIPAEGDQQEGEGGSSGAAPVVAAVHHEDSLSQSPSQVSRPPTGGVNLTKTEMSDALPDYPRSCYGWIVLAVDYRAGVYAVQMADGSYLPAVCANPDSQQNKCTEMELLIRCDWTRGGVDGEKFPDSVPLSSTELPESQQFDSVSFSNTAGGGAGVSGGGSDVWGSNNVSGASTDGRKALGESSATNKDRPVTSGGGTLGTINTKTASKTTKSANEAKRKKMKCGARVMTTTKVGKYSGIIACINSNSTFNVQADFGDYLVGVKLDNIECTEPS